MRIPLSLIPLALVVAVASARLPAQPLQYTVTPQFLPDGELSLSVELHCFAAGLDTVWFRLPNKINWSSGLWRCYSDLEVADSSNARLLRPDSLRIAVVRGPGASDLRLRYRLRQFPAGEQMTRALSLSPVLQPTYLHVPGECLFLLPGHYRTYEVSVEWRDLPPGWHLQSNLASGTPVQQVVARTADWRDGIWVAGDFRVLRGEVFGRPVFFAIRGQWSFDDAQLFDAVLRTIETQRDQWNDRDIPYFSVTMVPSVNAAAVSADDREREIIGYGKYQSFAVYAGRLSTMVRLLRLFNHEMMHHWIGGKIRDCPPGHGDALNWFAEGFTDYYALRNRWKAGFINEPDFFLEWNDRFVSIHYADPLADLPEAELRARRYTDDRAFKVPYRRGAILAFYLDCAIRQHTDNSQTLHDFMLELLAFTHGTGRNLYEHFDFFTGTLSRYLGEDCTAFVRRHATEGARIPPEAFRLPDFLRMSIDAAGAPQFSLNPDDRLAKDKFLK